MADRSALTIRHAGPLTLSSLGNALPAHLFRPTTQSNSQETEVVDPYRLGWECVPLEQEVRFAFRDMSFATAEGVATFAAIVECLRVKGNVNVQVDLDPRNEQWNQALGLSQIQRGEWTNILPNIISEINGRYVSSAWRCELRNREEAPDFASQVVRVLDDLPQDLLGDSREEITAALNLVIRESFLNVFEHAYPNAERRPIFGSLTVTPFPARGQLGALAYATSQELEWFQSNLDLGSMLEISIADFGLSVPCTLWSDFSHNHSSRFSELSGLNLGTREGQRARAALHQEIGLWAFNHLSSRKQPNDFPDDLARYNWRGLSRALNSAALLEACILIRSGQARAGYSFRKRSGSILRINDKIHREFPGTALVFRFPLHGPLERSRPLRGGKARPLQEINPRELISINKLAYNSVSDLGSDAVPVLGVVHPFSTLGETEISSLLFHMRGAIPQRVLLHLFCYPKNFAVLDSLRVFSEDISPIDAGVPRLVGFWAPDQRIIWKFVGALPEAARRIIDQLESSGAAYFDEESPDGVLVRQIAQAYGNCFQLGEGSIRLSLFYTELGFETLESALDEAFSMWLDFGHEGWLFEDPTHVYRLPTGRLVRRFVSVFKLLLSNDMLAQAVGLKLRRLLLSWQAVRAAPTIILAHSEASYFVARMLLRDKHIRADIYVRKLPGEVTPDMPVLVFADAVYKGETLTSLVRSLDRISNIICAVNLRDSHQFGDEIPGMLSLLSYPFDAQEMNITPVGPEPSWSLKHELEVDAVTHIPEEGAQSERIRIGTSLERDIFIDNTPEILRYGVHWANARVHTVSLSVTNLLNNNSSEVLGWLLNLVEEFADHYGVHNGSVDLVIFTRYEARVVRIVQEFCRNLKISDRKRISRVFSVVLPFAPAAPREVFGRISGGLLTGIAEAFSDRMQLTFDQPTDFVALFLDDHCVTGNNLRNFLIRAMTSDSVYAPKAILAVPVVSRLGPGEEFFLSSVCSTLSSPVVTREQVPFHFRSLFRLQVRSADAIQSTSTFGFLGRCLSAVRLMNEEMRLYIMELRDSLLSVHGGRVVRHPFHRGKLTNSRLISPRIVRIRHLIALHQQNIGVLGELLREGYKAFGEVDYDLLTLFALEPALLETPALQKAWGHDLAALAASCLKTCEHDGLRSDALTVLALSSNDLASRLTEVIPYISQDRDLIDQMLVLLVVLAPNQGYWIENMFSAVDRLGSNIPGDVRSYLRGFAASVAQIVGPAAVKTMDDAQAAVDRFVGGLAFHGRWLQPLTSINDWLSQREFERDGSEASYVVGKVKNAVSVMRNVVLPAVDGLLLLAKERNEISVASGLDDARLDLIHSLNFLAEFADNIGTGPVGRWVAQSIEEFWARIQDKTFKASPDMFLSTLREDEPSGIFERMMQRMFSSPADIIRHLVRMQLPGAEIFVEWERFDGNPPIVIAPYSVKMVVESSRLLLQDMERHGDPKSFRIEFSLKDVSGSSALHCKFSNRVRSDDLPRGGKSQARVKALALECGASVKFDNPKPAGERYEALLDFFEVRYISGD